MSDESFLASLMFALGAGVVWLLVIVYQQHKLIVQMTQTIQNCGDIIDAANGNIDDLNDEIIGAQVEAWTDYNTMGYTLDYLTTADEVNGSNCVAPA